MLKPAIFAAILPAVILIAIGAAEHRSSAFMQAIAKGQPVPVAHSSAAGTVLYIQTVRYKSEISDAQIKELLDSLQHVLSRIPQVRSIRVGRIIDQPREYDYAIAMEFDNIDDLNSYANSPIHRQWVQSHNPGSLTATHNTLTIRTGLDHETTSR